MKLDHRKYAPEHEEDQYEQPTDHFPLNHATSTHL